MPRRDQHRSQPRFWRLALIVLAAVLGVVAVWLEVFGDSQKQLQIAPLLGLWAGLIVAFLVFGSRRNQSDPLQYEALAEAEQRAHQLHEAQLELVNLQRSQLEAVQQARSSQELELRRFGELQLTREAAARREADLNLEISLRREIERMMAEQLGSLRDEVAALRAEVVDKLGGQLRLERIETTRLIGSDLEALQHEIRRLAGGQGDAPASTASQPIATGAAAVGSGTAAAPVGAASGASSGAADQGVNTSHEIIDAELVDPEFVSAVPGTPNEVWSRPTVSAPNGPSLSSVGPPVGGAGPSVAPAGPSVAPAGPSVGAVPASPAVVQPAPNNAQAPVATQAQPAAFQQPPLQATPVPEQAEPAPASATPAPVRAQAAPGQTEAAPVVGQPDATHVVAQPAPRAVTRTPPPTRQSDHVAAFSSSSDPFADLPRLSPVPEDVGLIQDAEVDAQAADTAAQAESAGRRRAPDDASIDDDRYRGRRRAAHGDPTKASAPDTSASDTGGHRRAEESAGRRRAPDDAPDDLRERLRTR